MLFGRAEESGVIRHLLRAARDGRGGALVLRGEAGAGTTALLEAAIAAARAEGMRVVATRGTEGESGLPHATLADVATPLLGPLDTIPGPQAAALRGALALAPPVPGDRFAVAAGLLSLVSRAAEADPLLLVVDDLQWVDPASAEALLFTARRLAPVRVALLAALRSGDPGDPAPGGLPVQEVRALGRDDAAALLGARAGAVPSPSVMDRVMRDTGGNPLALCELAEWIDPAQIRGSAPLPDPLPVGAGPARALARRLTPLPSATRRALVVAAAAGADPAVPAADALAALGLPPDALERAELHGVLSLAGGRITWRHPLMRAAVHAAAPAGDLRAAHAALADVTAGSTRAWHLAAARAAPDAEAAAALDAAGREALGRGAPVEAGRALRRAAEMTPDPPARTARLLAAADALAQGGRHDEALALLHDGAGEPRHAVRAARAGILAAAGEARAARAILEPEARALEDHDPATAGTLHVVAAMTAAIAADVPAVIGLARRGLALLDAAGAPGPARAAARAFLAQGLILAGDTAAGRPLLDDAAACLARTGETTHPPLTRAVVLGHLWIGDLEEARRILDRVVTEARAASAAGSLPYPLAVMAVLDARAGRWDAAEAAGAEAARLAVETGQPSVEALAGIGPVQVAAGRGRVADCDALAARIDDLSDTAGADSLLLYTAAARGLARLAAGDAAGAVVHLERADRLARRRGVANPSAVPYGADLVEALWRAGRRGDAAAAHERLRIAAEGVGDTWSRTASARCAGIVGGDPGWEEALTAALAAPGADALPFDHARTALVLGERLRRERRPGEARPHLRYAAEAFDRLGAAPWRTRAEVEARATGDTGWPAAPAPRDGLTPQERRVAHAVARGATNREAAAELSLSHKTVEHHLGRVYAKLGVRSRTELALLLGGGRAVESPGT